MTAFFRQLYRNRVGFLGFVLSALVVLLALLAPLIRSHDPLEQSIRDRFEGPTRSHLLGTDNFGRDIYSRVLHGYRTSVVVALTAVGLATVVGTLIGLVAAYYGGFIDRLLMRLMDILLAFPIILLAIAVVAVLGSGTVNTALAIGIVYTPIFARLARGPALSVLAWDYVAAATALGAGAAASCSATCYPTWPLRSWCRPPWGYPPPSWSRPPCHSWGSAPSRRRRRWA